MPIKKSASKATGKASRTRNERTHVTHEFPALYDRESRVLLLGSIPSPKSREMAFYYGHPQNRFWKVMAVVLGEATLSEIAAGKGAPETIAQKKAMLKKHHVALWDVLDSCTIVGANDLSIEDPVVNNIKDLIEKSKVTRIFCTGATAHKLYQKLCAKDVGIDAIKLPSTSPANCAVSLERLVEKYKAILG